MIGGGLFGLSFLIVGYVPSLVARYLWYRVIGGIGISVAYAGALGNGFVSRVLIHASEGGELPVKAE